MGSKPLSDIIAGCRRNHETAQQAFYERFYGYGLAVCLAYADNREDARELLNDGFLKAFRAMPDLNSEEAVRPWLRRILVNTAIDYHRKSLRRVSTESLPTDTDALPEAGWAEDTVMAHLSAEHILATLQTLPLPYRLVFSLYVLEGYNHAEIAAQLQLAESTSRAHLSEANRLMRRALTHLAKSDYERTR
ncbi:MAG: sigma-70 family RNA polymerase sigma factor [Cytophagales bacterium]|nr:MAG: sigma-70 family RNA polymerase sigma factor [Cytophagales bacterium]